MLVVAQGENGIYSREEILRQTSDIIYEKSIKFTN